MRDGFRPHRDWRLGKRFVIDRTVSAGRALNATAAASPLWTKLRFTDQSGFLLSCAFVLFLLQLPRELFRRRLLLV